LEFAAGRYEVGRAFIVEALLELDQRAEKVGRSSDAEGRLGEPINRLKKKPKNRGAAQDPPAVFNKLMRI
jgi:hypothetical protein